MFDVLRYREMVGWPVGLTKRLISANPELVQRMELQRTLQGHLGCVNTCSWDTEGGATLITGSDDLQVILWDWEAGRQRLRFSSGHRNNVFQARMLPHSGGTRLVTCAADGQVRLAELPEGAASLSVATSLLGQHSGRAHKLALDPLSPAACFYSTGEDGQVIHYDLRIAAAGGGGSSGSSGGRRKLLLCHGYNSRTRATTNKIVGINAITTNPTRPWQFAVGGADLFARVYDCRITRDSSSSSSSHAPGSSSSSNGAFVGPPTRQQAAEARVYSMRDEPVAVLCPQGLQAGQQRGQRGGVPLGEPHITCVAFSRQGELLASYNDDNIYLFGAQAASGSSSSGSRQGQQQQQQQQEEAAVVGRGGAAAGEQQQQQQECRRGGGSSSCSPARRSRAAAAADGAAAAALPAQQQQQQLEATTAGEPGEQPQHTAAAAAAAGSTAAGSTAAGSTAAGSTAAGSTAAGSTAAAAAGEGDEEEEERPRWRRRQQQQQQSPLAAAAAQSDEPSSSSAAAAVVPGLDGGSGRRWLHRHPWQPPVPPPATGYGLIAARFFDCSSSSSSSDGVVACYYGHRNAATVKGVSFFGEEDEWVLSGSDDGHIYLWSKAGGQIVWWQRGDADVVNCLEPHPLLPLFLATSGIDSDVKLWAPTAAAPQPLPAAALAAQMQLNEEEQQAARQASTVPEDWLLHLIAAQRRRARAAERARRQQRQGDAAAAAAPGGGQTGDAAEDREAEDEQAEEEDLDQLLPDGVRIVWAPAGRRRRSSGREAGDQEGEQADDDDDDDDDDGIVNEDDEESDDDGAGGYEQPCHIS